MSGITWRFYNERTGNPVADNRARNANRGLTRKVKASIGFTGMSRKRKKQAWRIEGANYGLLIIAVSKQLYERDHPVPPEADRRTL